MPKMPAGTRRHFIGASLTAPMLVSAAILGRGDPAPSVASPPASSVASAPFEARQYPFYVQPGQRTAVTLDQIEATMLPNPGGPLQVRLFNPTGLAARARARTLIESSLRRRSRWASTRSSAVP